MDEALEEGADLPAPGMLAAEIVESLAAALDEFRQVAEELGVDDAMPVPAD